MQRTCRASGPAVRGAVVAGLNAIPRRAALAQAGRQQHRLLLQPVHATGPDRPGEEGNTDYAAVAASLNALLAKSPTANITGQDLWDLVRQKWGRSYDVRLCRLQGRMYLQVMWKFLEQQSFPLTETEYLQQLDAVAEYLTDWGVADTVRQTILQARKPPGYTIGGRARCISIPLAVDLGGSRSSEWN